MRKVLAFHINYILERHSYCEMEGKIPTEFRMDQRVVRLVLSLIGRIDGLHTSIETQHEEVEVQSQAEAVARSQVRHHSSKGELSSRLLFIISESPDVTRIDKGCSVELPEQVGAILQVQVQLQVAGLGDEVYPTVLVLIASWAQTSHRPASHAVRTA